MRSPTCSSRASCGPGRTARAPRSPTARPRWSRSAAGRRRSRRGISRRRRDAFGWRSRCTPRASSHEWARLVSRGSYGAGVEAYRRALLLAPSFNLTFQGRATERLARLLAAEAYVWREGRRDGDAYSPLPELVSDTLAYRPEP